MMMTMMMMMIINNNYNNKIIWLPNKHVSMFRQKGLCWFPCIYNILLEPFFKEVIRFSTIHVYRYLMTVDRLQAEIVGRLTNSAKCIPAMMLVCMHMPSSVSHKHSSLKQNHTIFLLKISKRYHGIETVRP